MRGSTVAFGEIFGHASEDRAERPARASRATCGAFSHDEARIRVRGLPCGYNDREPALGAMELAPTFFRHARTRARDRTLDASAAMSGQRRRDASGSSQDLGSIAARGPCRSFIRAVGGRMEGWAAGRIAHAFCVGRYCGVSKRTRCTWKVGGGEKVAIRRVMDE